MEKVKISQVKTNDSNPRYIKDHKFKKLVESIKNFPEMLEARPIVVNKEMVVLGGNMRLRACQKAGLKEVFIEQVDWSDEKQREFIIKDNASFGEWDWDVLANEWETTQLSDWGLDIPKWDNNDDFDSDVVETGEYDFPNDVLEGSHVRMVQLFLNDKTEPILKEWELKLREVHGTGNLTDTIYQVMKKAYEDNNEG